MRVFPIVSSLISSIMALASRMPYAGQNPLSPPRRVIPIRRAVRPEEHKVCYRHADQKNPRKIRHNAPLQVSPQLRQRLVEQAHRNKYR